MVRCFTQEEIRQLLHNKFVVILGDSIQRSVYKDLVVHLQRNNFATNAQLKSKGELSFEGDVLVEGGKYGELTNGTDYREVRQYRTDHHLVRFYFLTRVYSEYLESILNDFVNGPQPDVIIINSCVWDVSRYGSKPMKQYTQKLDKLFTRLGDTILSECLVIWNMAMPLGKKISGGFLVPELQHLDKTLRTDVIEGNFYSATVADLHKFDVLDLHYHFRFELQNRVKDGIHWNPIAHRRVTHLLLSHIADAWNVEVPPKSVEESSRLWNEHGQGPCGMSMGPNFQQPFPPPPPLLPPYSLPSLQWGSLWNENSTPERFEYEQCKSNQSRGPSPCFGHHSTYREMGTTVFQNDDPIINAFFPWSMPNSADVYVSPGYTGFDDHLNIKGYSGFGTVNVIQDFGRMSAYSRGLKAAETGYFANCAPFLSNTSKNSARVMRRRSRRPRDSAPYSRPYYYPYNGY